MTDMSRQTFLSFDITHGVKQSFINVDLTKVLTELSAPDANPFHVPEIISIKRKEKTKAFIFFYEWHKL